jgi:hypothetical protein
MAIINCINLRPNLQKEMKYLLKTVHVHLLTTLTVLLVTQRTMLVRGIPIYWTRTKKKYTTACQTAPTVDQKFGALHVMSVKMHMTIITTTTIQEAVAQRQLTAAAIPYVTRIPIQTNKGACLLVCVRVCVRVCVYYYFFYRGCDCITCSTLSI